MVRVDSLPVDLTYTKREENSVLTVLAKTQKSGDFGGENG